MYKKAPLKELSTHVSCTSALSCPRCLKKWRQIWEWRGCLRWELKLGQQVLFFLSFDIIWEFVCLSVCTKWPNMVSSSCLVSVLRARKKLWLILFANVPAYFVISYHRFTFLSFPFSGQGLSSVGNFHCKKFPICYSLKKTKTKMTMDFKYGVERGGYTLGQRYFETRCFQQLHHIFIFASCEFNKYIL